MNRSMLARTLRSRRKAQQRGAYGDAAGIQIVVKSVPTRQEETRLPVSVAHRCLGLDFDA